MIEPAVLKFPSPIQFLFLVLRTGLFLIAVMALIVTADLEILMKLAALVGAWLVTGATQTVSPIMAWKFLKNKQKAEGSVVPVATMLVSGTTEEVFERLLDAVKLENDSRIVQFDPDDKQFTAVFSGRKYGANFERKMVACVRPLDQRRAKITLESTSRSIELSFQAQNVIGRQWVDLRLRMLDYKFLDRLLKSVSKRLELRSQELRAAANAKCCQITDCACHSFLQFDHPIKKWGWGFTIKFGLLLVILCLIQSAVAVHVPVPRFASDLCTYFLLAILLQVGLAGIWLVLFHRLFSNLRSASKGVFQSPSWHTILAPIIFNQAIAAVLLCGGAYVVSLIIPGLHDDPQTHLPIIYAVLFIPVFLGSLVYLSLFHRVSSFLKTQGAQAPNAILSAIQVSTAIFAPILILLWSFNYLFLVVFPLIQLITYVLVFWVLNSYYEAVRDWIHTSQKSTAIGAPVCLSPNKAALDKAAGAIRAIIKIDAFKLAAVCVVCYFIAGYSTLVAKMQNDAAYGSTTSRVMVAGERPEGTQTILKTTRSIRNGETIKVSDIVEEKLSNSAPVDALFDKRTAVGAEALLNIDQGDILTATDVPFTRAEEDSLRQDARIPIGPKTATVVVATRPIKAGELFTADNVKCMQLSEIQVPTGAMASEAALWGYQSACDIPYRGLIKSKHVQVVTQHADSTTTAGH